MSSKDLKSDKKSVQFYDGSLEDLIKHELSRKYNHVWMGGGSALTKSIIRAGLADEIMVSVMPIILGNGLPYFAQVGVTKDLSLQGVRTYKNGMVEMTYRFNK